MQQPNHQLAWSNTPFTRAAPITVCTACVVRAQCLALSLRRWDVGRYGVWGGLVAAERMALRRELHPSLPRLFTRK